MKHSLRMTLIVAALLIASGLSAQVAWEESFDSNPGNWTLESNWSISGGMLRLDWSPQQDNFDLSATSPQILLPANALELIVTHQLDDYSGVDETAEISIVHPGGEDVLWSYAFSNGDFPSQDDVMNVQAYSGQNVQIRFRGFGSSTWNINNWWIDHVQITGLNNNDLSATQLLGPASAEVGQEGTWTVRVRNTGMTVQSNFSVHLYKEGDVELGSVTGQGPLESGAIMDFDFTWMPTYPEQTHIWGAVTPNAADDIPANDETDDLYITVWPAGTLNILVWDNDNNSDLTNPQYQGCEAYLEDALDQLGLTYTSVGDLPFSLSEYDVVLVTCGVWCYG